MAIETAGIGAGEMTSGMSGGNVSIHAAWRVCEAGTDAIGSENHGRSFEQKVVPEDQDPGQPTDAGRWPVLVEVHAHARPAAFSEAGRCTAEAGSNPLSLKNSSF